jgi:pimeloyl-ACP methyl ester carboxylesterase
MTPLRILVIAALLPGCSGDPSVADPTGDSTAAPSSSSGTPTSASTTSVATSETVGSTTRALDSGDSGTPDSSGGASSESSGGVVQGPDLRMPGPHDVDTSSDSFPTGGCTMGYDVFTPTDVVDAPSVVLAHGFQGNRGSMADWAAHYASWGLTVVTPDLCHATILDADHAQNGVDLVALADHLELATPIYAGYSAGGLAALLAVAQDPDARALLGLDTVDSGGLGAAVAASVAIPAHDITSEASMCNSTANGVPVFDAIADSEIVRVLEADHCDFQSPPDGFCSLCSAPNSRHTTESIQTAIRGLSTAALLWRAGLDDSGAQWWTPGSDYYDAMIEDGTLAQL